MEAKGVSLTPAASCGTLLCSLAVKTLPVCSSELLLQQGQLFTAKCVDRCTSRVVYSLLRAVGAQVYPNGNGVALGVYLSVFLEMVASPHQLCGPSKYEYRIEMGSTPRDGTQA